MRLKEEMGFDCELKELFAITYRAELDNNIIEHEIDHVFFGTYDKDPQPDPGGSVRAFLGGYESASR